MKKSLIISLLSVTLVLPMFSLADNVLGNTGASDRTITVDAPSAGADQAKIQYISLGFCDDKLTTAIHQAFIDIRPGQTKEICTVFYNSSTGDTISIVSSFVDTQKDDSGKLACGLGIKTGSDSLASLVSYDPKEYAFTLAPQEQIIRKARITIPKNMTGMLYGCLGYQLDIKKPADYKGLFFVVRRKVGLMNVNITGDVYGLGLWDNVRYTYKDHQTAILRIIAGILVILLIYYIAIATKTKKPSKHHTNK